MDNKLIINSNNSNINVNRSRKYCHECNKTDVKLYKCSRCRFAKYCGVECQKKAWPEHIKVCKPPKKDNLFQNEKEYDLLVKQLDEICKTKPNPFLPGFQNQLAPKEFRILKLAKKCLDKGFIDLAHDCIYKHTSMTVIKEQYFNAYAKKMFEMDKNNVSVVMKKGISLVSENKIRFLVIEQLCAKRLFKTAYICAKEEKNEKLQSILLEVIASNLKIIGKYELAKLVAEKILDEGRKKDLLEMLIDL